MARKIETQAILAALLAAACPVIGQSPGAGADGVLERIEGFRLSALRDAEQKVEILLKSAGGEESLDDFDVADED